MEHKFKTVRQQLDDLGYFQTFVPDCLDLVEKLTADLIKTTQSLKKYKKIAQETIEEKNELQLGAEPYKCDNAKLVKECNDLHLTFLKVREQNEKMQRDFKRRLAALEREKLECDAECKKLKNRVKDLDLQLSRRNEKPCAIHNKPSQTSVLKSTRTKDTGVSLPQTSKSKTNSKINIEVHETGVMCDQKVVCLNKEIKRLKDEHSLLAECNETLKNQLCNRDREIERLMQMLEGGRPFQALNQDCCYKDVDGKVTKLRNEICCLEKEKSELECQLKDCIAKQHEAMRRALNLAERNKKLEQELHEIDQMALAVEADCNSNTKISAEKLNRMQEKMHDNVLQMKTMERDLTEMKREKQRMLSDLESLKMEKRNLQSVLETALDEKKRLNDQINQFTIIEHDLNLEIDRLVQTSANQKRKIAELECRLLSEKFEAPPEQYKLENIPTTSDMCMCVESPKTQNTSKNRTKKSLKTNKNSKEQKTMTSKTSGNSKKTALNTSGGLKGKKLMRKNDNNSKNNRVPSPSHHSSTTSVNGLLTISKITPKMKQNELKIKTNLKQNLSETKPNSDGDKALNSPRHSFVPNNTPCSPCRNTTFHDVPDNDLAASIATKRNTCCNCCCSTKPKLDRAFMYDNHSVKRDISQTHIATDKNRENLDEIMQKLCEKDQLISTLQHENKVLSQEKHNLMTRLETNRNMFDEGDTKLLKAQLKKVERDRDIIKGDVVRLEEERDVFKQRLRSISEAQNFEQARLKNMVIELESQVQQLEKERREMMQTQGSRRATISYLEDQCRELQDQLQGTQVELNQHRSVYSQLKNLQEQTDKALADSQAQIIQLEVELEKYQSRSKSLDKEKTSKHKEVSDLRNDIRMMKDSLTKIDQEKDSLLISVDDKTEKLSKLEDQLRDKDNQIMVLQSSESELKKKLGAAIEINASREQMLKSASTESTTLQRDLDTANRIKESSMKENRRLQNELAACTVDCKCHMKELEAGRKQIEDLKRQLQHYVTEVKRFEDLISQKEGERAELLEQFRNLSQEAIQLENNNHSLENVATQSKVQLSVTLDHVADLENKLTCQCNLISSYEDQVNDLKKNVTNLETRLSGAVQHQKQAETDLAAVRDLCLKLDKQKDTLMQEISEKNSQQSQMDKEVLNMRKESEELLLSMAKDRMSLENVEHLLTEARQESVQLKLCNEELESEVKTLKDQIEDMQQRFANTTDKLEFYQRRALHLGGDSEQHERHTVQHDISQHLFRTSDEGRRFTRTATFTCSTNVQPQTNTHCTCCQNCSGREVNMVDSVAFSYDLTCKCCGKRSEIIQVTGPAVGEANNTNKQVFNENNIVTEPASSNSERLTSFQDQSANADQEKFCCYSPKSNFKDDNSTPTCPINAPCLSMKIKNTHDKYATRKSTSSSRRSSQVNVENLRSSSKTYKHLDSKPPSKQGSVELESNKIK